MNEEENASSGDLIILPVSRKHAGVSPAHRLSDGGPDSDAQLSDDGRRSTSCLPAKEVEFTHIQTQTSDLFFFFFF